MRRRSVEGFTVAETVVALALTAIVVSAAAETLYRAVDLFRTSRRVRTTDETLQGAMTLIVRDFIQAGRGVPLGGIPIPSGPGSTAIIRPGPGSLTFAEGRTTLPAILPGGGLGPPVIGVRTDAVNVFYADQALDLGRFPLAAIAPDGRTITFDRRLAIDGPDGVHAGDLILFSNPLGNAIGMVTDEPDGQRVVLAPGDPLHLNQPRASQGTILNLQSAPGLYPPTTATRLLLLSYFIDTITDPSLPRLVRQVNARPPVAVALGAENLQLSYDYVDGASNPANQKHTPPGNSPNQIRKVNLFLSARSLERNPRTDNYFRDSMGTEIGLRSLSYVSRYR